VVFSIHKSGLGAARARAWIGDRETTAATGRSLTTAREGAEKARKLLQNGADPIDSKTEDRARARKTLEDKKALAKRECMTLVRVAHAYHERVIEPSRNIKHAA